MKSKSRKESVKYLNKILLSGSKREFFRSIIDPKLGISDLVDKFAIPLYFEEMKIDRRESTVDLPFNDIVASIKVLTAIARITKAVDTKNSDLVYKALSCPDAYIANLKEESKTKYCKALRAIRCEKQETGEKCSLLTYFDVQECIDIVNEQCAEYNKAVNVLRNLNEAVKSNSRSKTMDALKQILLKLKKKTSPEDASLYLRLLKLRLDEKRHDECELRLEDVDKITEIVLSESETVHLVCTILGQINMGLERNDLLFTTDVLHLANPMLTEKHNLEIFEALKTLKRTKEQKYTCPYMRYKTFEGNESIIDLENYAYTWDRLKSISESRFITKDDVDLVIRSVVIAKAFQDSTSKDFEKLIVKLQARSRGYLLRKKVAHNTGTIVDNRAPRYGLQQRRNRRLLHIRINDRPVDARKFQNTKGSIEMVMDHYGKHEDKIRKIQALWRGRAARKAFHSLLRMDEPPFSVVQRFCGILDFNAGDYTKDLKLQQLKKDVVQLIKHNQNLSHELDKIGLFIENKDTDAPSAYKGMQPLSAEGQQMLDGYQHLFYELQTNPNYLAKLLFLLPESTSHKFLLDVVQTIFNFGSSLRDEYFLLKLLETALREEISCKFENPSEVVTGNSLILKMVVDYTKISSGPPVLKKIIGPIIEQLICYETIRIETNPVKIYNHWRNKLETEIGRASNLPYTVSEHEALQYEQVQSRLNSNIKLLQSAVRECLNHITASRNSIPYGIQYIAKVLSDTLTEKFPEAPEVSILKVVGNLIYRSFINDALVAPDAYDIAALRTEQFLSNELRKNLAIIAKFLVQFASSEKGLSEEPPYLQTRLNLFALECQEKFARFFRDCCAIEGLDDHFRMNEYTEATLVRRPEIAISLQGIRDTHGLLVEYQDRVAPDPMDPLHMMLDDLGYTPTVASLLELTGSSIEVDIDQLWKTEVTLALSKLEVPENDDANLNRLFIKTKELLVSIIQFLKGETLLEALETEREDPSNIQSYSSLISESQISASLEDCKLQLRAYLNQLELGGWVSRGDAYQSIVTEVANDLRNKGRYRVLRNNEKQMLRVAIDQCLANLSTLNRTSPVAVETYDN